MAKSELWHNDAGRKELRVNSEGGHRNEKYIPA